MELRISKQAQAVIQEKRPSNTRMLLDFEDAIGPFADDSVSCQLVYTFRQLSSRKIAFYSRYVL